MKYRGRWDLALNVAVREVDSLCHGKLLQCIRYALSTLLWAGTEYLICGVFNCNLSHLHHPVCHCDLFRIFWHLKKKVSKNTTMPDCFAISQISAFLLACPAILPPKFGLSSLSCKCTDHQNRLYSEPCLSNECWSYIVCY